LFELDRVINGYHNQIKTLAKAQSATKRILQLEGIEPLTATSLVATVGEAKQLKNGRHFAAWLGLVPRQRSSDGKARYGCITKRGDVYLRTLLIYGVRTVLRHVENKTDHKSQWAKSIR